MASPTDAAPPSPDRRRFLRLGAATVGITATGLVASRWVRSPQQALADQQAPAFTTLTAAVEQRVVRDTVVLRGQVGAGASFEVTPVVRDAGRAVVTAVRVTPGQEFGAGAVVVEVAGRPLVALPGAMPAYRDLRPGAEGRDVTQLQAALAAVGFDPGEADGVLGAGTKRALRDFYDSIGHPVPVAGDGSEVAGARQQVRTAERALADVLAASAGPSKQVTYAREDLDAAREHLAAAERSSGPMLPLSEVVFLPSFPARVVASKAVVGAEVAAPLVTVAAGALLVRAGLDPGRRSAVEPGAPVEIHSEVLGVSARGTVASVGDLAADATGDRSHALVIGPAGDPLDPRLAGQDVRLVLQADSTGGEVLAVPISAVFLGADGRATTIRVHGDGHEEKVLVDVGLSGDGFLAVTPVQGALRPGDRVVTGTRPSR
jgi:HlyD family secretion protein